MQPTAEIGTAGPELSGRLTDLALSHAPAAIERLARLIDGDDDKLALAAAQEILNRALGRPVAAAVDAGRDRDASKEIVIRWSPAEDPRQT